MCLERDWTCGRNSGADEKVVGEAGVFPDVEGEDVETLLLPCEAGASKQYLPRGDDGYPLFLTVQPWSVMYRSTRRHSPRSDFPANLLPMERDEMSSTGSTGQSSRPPGRR